MNTVRPRLVLSFIVLIFGAPVVIAVMMHSQWWDYRPADTVNHGALVKPAVPLDYEQLRFVSSPVAGPGSLIGRWTILYPVMTDCRERCLSDVAALRQIHRAAGRRQTQLAAVLLLPAGSGTSLHNRLRKVYEVFPLAYDRDGSVTAELRSVGDTANGGQLQAGQVFLADPTGNIMMRYAAGFDPADLNEDLERLLKWSAQDG